MKAKKIIDDELAKLREENERLNRENGRLLMHNLELSNLVIELAKLREAAAGLREALNEVVETNCIHCCQEFEAKYAIAKFDAAMKGGE